jgi:LysM repeat protein
MTRKQMALIIVVNAVISTVISLLVVLLLVRSDKVGETPMVQSTAAPTEAVVEAEVTPTPGIVVHVIQGGDTISGLAFQYDVPEADIIAANNLENPNFLQVGMEIVIPIGGVVEATATFTPAPTPTDTPIPFEPPSAEMTATAAAEAGLVATAEPTASLATGDIQIDITEMIGPGQLEQERVVITNNGDGLADMQGWMLSDNEGNVYTFPNFRLWAGGNVTVHTHIGQDGNPPANFYWGKLEAVWSTGETATLANSQGEVVSTYVIGQ